MKRNRLIIVKRFLMILLSIDLLETVNASIRRDFNQYFDPFYYKDLFEELELQQQSARCTIETGPNCFHILFFSFLGIPEAITTNISSLSLNALKTFYQDETATIQSRIKADPHYADPVEIKSSFEYSLLLTMESFNEITAIKDTEMPPEMVVPYTDFYLILHFIGKIRLTNDHIESPTDETPSLTYGVIEEDIEVLFNRPLIVEHIFVRKHKTESNETSFFTMTGYIGHMKVYAKHEPVTTDAWTKITFEEHLVDSIHMEKGVDFDNLKVVYKSHLDPWQKEKRNSAFIKKLNKLVSGKVEEEDDSNNRNSSLKDG